MFIYRFEVWVTYQHPIIWITNNTSYNLLLVINISDRALFNITNNINNNLLIMINISERDLFNITNNINNNLLIVINISERALFTITLGAKWFWCCIHSKYDWDKWVSANL